MKPLSILRSCNRELMGLDQGTDFTSNLLYTSIFKAGGASGSVNPVAEMGTVVLLMLLGEREGVINLTIITKHII